MFRAASRQTLSTELHNVATLIETGKISPTEASLRLATVRMALSQTAQQAVEAMGAYEASSREDVMDGFKKANPSLSKEDLEEIADQWEKNKDVVKDKHAAHQRSALSQVAQQAVQAMGKVQANSREEVMKGFKKANPKLSDADLEEIADQWEKNKDVVKDKHT